MDATNAEIENLKTSKIDATTVQTKYMSMANWTSEGKIRADRIDADTITSKLSESNYILVGDYLGAETIRANQIKANTIVFGIEGWQAIDDTCTWEDITVGGKTYKVLCKGA